MRLRCSTADDSGHGLPETPPVASMLQVALGWPGAQFVPRKTWSALPDVKVLARAARCFLRPLGSTAVNAGKREPGVHSRHVTNLLLVIRTDNLWLARVRRRGTRFRRARKSRRHIQALSPSSTWQPLGSGSALDVNIPRPLSHRLFRAFARCDGHPRQ